MWMCVVVIWFHAWAGKAWLSRSVKQTWGVLHRDHSVSNRLSNLWMWSFLWPLYGIGQAIIFLSCGFFLLLSFFYSSPNLSGHRLCGPSANLECRSEMCCTWLAGNAGPQKSPKIRHLGTIAQLYRAISLQLRHVSTIGKKLVKQQYLLPHVFTIWWTSPY